METEIWKKHPEIEKLEVSSFGRVRTLDRVVSSEKYTRFTKGRVLKQYRNAVNCYMQVHVRVDGKQAVKYVHRLVAQTFIENNGNLPEVNHKDNDRTNNNVSNLEWCTAKYNRQYREKYGISQTEAIGHPLFAINLTTLEVSHFRSQREASREFGVHSRSISNVINGKLKHAGGFWFVNDDDKATDAIKNKLHNIRKGE
jgi:hypothetical protein